MRSTLADKPIIVFALAVFILSSCSSIKKSQRPVYGNNGGIIAQPAGPTIKRSGPYVMEKPDKDDVEKYSAIMSVNKSDIKNGRLYSFIDEWMGTPYKFGGLDKDGVDCSGFVYRLQQEVYDIENMPRSTNTQINFIKRKYEDELKEGDLVFFDFDGRQFSHVGVYLQNGYVVHASTRKGVMIIKLKDPYMYKYFSRGGSVMVEREGETESSGR